jgi:SAM-dependent methyltransferase
MARDETYAQYFAASLLAPRRVLEIGCGTGKLLRALLPYWQESELVGIDPAFSGAADEAEEKPSLVRASLAHYANESAGSEKFDLLLSINAIEHLPAVDDFFSAASRLISDDGRLALICPAAYPPNQELLFYDHIHTFTSEALSAIARTYGFFLRSAITRLPMGDFQYALFSRRAGDEGSLQSNEAEFAALAQSRADYLESWSRLDDALIERTKNGKPLAIFGAGQMAALLRAYTPRMWGHANCLLVDNLADAWGLGKLVLQYAKFAERREEATVIVATTPGAQEKVAQRLFQDGFSPVRFDDIIAA